MADVLTPEQRHKCMSSIQRENTSPEILLRSILHESGLRYRLHDKNLPGSPDIVFRRFRAVLFVHGCYWHSHGCFKSTIPKSRSDFWKNKFQDNRLRDQRNIQSLLEKGWRVMVVWGCALIGRESYPSSLILDKVNDWLLSSETLTQLPEIIEAKLQSNINLQDILTDEMVT